MASKAPVPPPPGPKPQPPPPPPPKKGIWLPPATPAPRECRLPMVYILGPYTQGDVAVNVAEAMTIWDELFDSGLVLPVCPHLTHFQHINRPRSKGEWLRWGLGMAARCDAGVRRPGPSEGSDQEEALLHRLGRPVFWPLSACLEWAQSQSWRPA